MVLKWLGTEQASNLLTCMSTTSCISIHVSLVLDRVMDTLLPMLLQKCVRNWQPLPFW